MGSTSYDEAREPTDATWSGASWYGPSSGEYWIVNPREYADPRKHGPGYQQRARRSATGDGPTGAEVFDADDEVGAAASVAQGVGTEERAAPARPRARAAADAATGATGPSAPPEQDPEAGRWRPPARREWAAARAQASQWSAAEAARAGAAMPGDAAPRDAMQSIAAAGRELLGGSADDPIRRLGLALVAWPPIGLAAAAAIGDLTGCTTYSVECSGSDSLLPWLAQAGILGLLLLLPVLSRLFVGGTIAVLLALVPVTAFLLVLGGGNAPQAAFVLSLLLAGAWLAGVGWAARGAARSSA
jgi:hypothetical protein